ncbi:MAG: flavodoxin [Lachnospiraceae bacterium]|nr:flavodoxin [Candidatus Equihabitans merdae]
MVESAEDDNDLAESTEQDVEEKTAVVCFSATGNTMAIAEMIADETDADLFEIIPAEKYTDEDLNYSDDECRANKEQNDPDARPEIENDLSAVEEYSTIYLGYPIWWGTNPRIIQTFLDIYDLSDAVIYTFCTSGGSGIEKSISDLQTLYPDLQIVTGKRLNNASENEIKEWVNSLSD